MIDYSIYPQHAISLLKTFSRWGDLFPAVFSHRMYCFMLKATFWYWIMISEQDVLLFWVFLLIKAWSSRTGDVDNNCISIEQDAVQPEVFFMFILSFVTLMRWPLITLIRYEHFLQRSVLNRKHQKDYVFLFLLLFFSWLNLCCTQIYWLIGHNL